MGRASPIFLVLDQIRSKGRSLASFVAGVHDLPQAEGPVSPVELAMDTFQAGAQMTKPRRWKTQNG